MVPLSEEKKGILLMNNNCEITRHCIRKTNNKNGITHASGRKSDEK